MHNNAKERIWIHTNTANERKLTDHVLKVSESNGNERKVTQNVDGQKSTCHFIELSNAW